MASRRSNGSVKSALKKSPLFSIDVAHLARQNTIDLNLRVRAKSPDAEKFRQQVDQLRRFVQNNTELMEVTGKEMARLVAERIDYRNVPDLETQVGNNNNEALSRAAEKIQNVVAKSTPVVLGKNKVGIISKAELDAIKIETSGQGQSFGRGVGGKGASIEERNALDIGLTIKGDFKSTVRKTFSPYDIAWMILEFGSGRYALNKRLTDDGEKTKVLGGGGAWKWGPRVAKYGGNRVGPILIGQKPDSFLFETRENAKQFARDRDHLLRFVSQQLMKFFSRNRDDT